jgi:hypothetical protein
VLTIERTTDNDDEVTLTGGALLNLGKIRIDLARGKNNGDLPGIGSRSLVTPDVGVASEKGKKYVTLLLIPFCSLIDC